MKNNKSKLAKIFRPAWLGIFKPGRSENCGFTLLLSVLVTSIILSVGLGIFNIMTKELKLSGMGRESQIAFYAADAGIECFFFWEIKHPNLADSAFNAVNTINCAGNSVANNFSVNVSNFSVPLSNNSCAKIKVTKSGLITTVESRGYNTACDSTSPFKVERAIQLVSTKQEGGGVYAPPEAPSNLNIARVWASKMRLTWSNSCGSDSSCSYAVYRSIDGSAFSLATSGITSSNYEDTGLLPSTLYYYYVAAVNSNGESDESNKVSDTTPAYSESRTFAYKGSQQTWLVPENVTSISIKASGAQGNGLGGESSAIVAVTPGETLYIYVGEQPLGRIGGWNGGGNGGSTSWGGSGGGGGGASDVRQGGTTLTNRIIVAGGGGGRGSNDAGGSRMGGSGGNAGGVAGSSGGSGANDAPVSGGGAGGTQTSGGIGGTAGGGNGGASGNPGAVGNGGAGGVGPSGASGGGGGGGGYLGGGGGGVNYQSAGGGGGGSSYVTGASTSMKSGVRSGDGQVVIEYDTGASAPASPPASPPPISSSSSGGQISSTPSTPSSHPFLIVKESMYSALQARASQSPWKEMKAEAISEAKSLSYPANGSNLERITAMRQIMNYSALAYILDPANRVSYKNKIRDTISYWSSLFPDLDHSLWGDTARGGGAYAMSVLALDIIYNDLTAAERSSAEYVLGTAQYGWGWPHNKNGAPLIFALYKNNRTEINKWKKLYREEIFGPGGPIGKGQLTPDGAYTAGPTYGMSKLGAATYTGGSKGHIMDVLEFTGEDTYYTNSTIRGFNRWLFTFASNPFRNFTVFGDTIGTDGPWNVGRNYTMEKYSLENAAMASWYLNGELPIGNSLFTYILMEKSLPTAQKPTSHIFTDGGAAFWERNSSDQSLMGAMLNMKNTEWHTHKEVNAIYLAGYGEHLLVNAGYTGPTTGAGSFSRDWLSRNANSGNTVLIDRKDHKLYSAYITMYGNGVTEGFTSSLFDYASGDSGEALPNGQHQRNFIFVHPQDGKNGYWTLFDEVTATNPALTTANVLLHPNSDSYSVIAGNQEYQWKINGPFKQQTKDTYLNIFLGTTPSSVLLKDSVFAQGSGYLVNKYLDSTYPTNSSGQANIATVLFPHDASHAKATMSRLTGSNYSGASIDHGSSIIDYALANSSTGTVQYGAVSFIGQSALYRLNNNANSFYFVRQGTSFDDGSASRRGFTSSSKVSLYMKNTQGKIVSPGTNVTFYYPGLAGVTVDGQYKAGTTVYVSAGTREVSLNIK